MTGVKNKAFPVARKLLLLLITGRFLVRTKNYLGAQALASSVVRVGKLTRVRGTVARRVVPPLQSLLGSGLLYLRRGSIGAGKAPIMSTRSEIGTSLHKLANYVECELAEITRMLFAEAKHTDAKDIVYSGCSFIESLRDARDNESKGGDA
jgi:hypothetical protein